MIFMQTEQVGLQSLYCEGDACRLHDFDKIQNVGIDSSEKLVVCYIDIDNIDVRYRQY